MSAVNGVNRSQNVSGIMQTGGLAMSPEAIIMMLMKEMGSIDDVLNQMKEKIQDTTARVRNMNKQIEVLRSIKRRKDELIDKHGKIDFSKLTADEIRALAESGVLSPEDLSEAYHYFAGPGSDPAKAQAIQEGMKAAGQEVIPKNELPGDLDTLDPYVGVGTHDNTSRDEAVKALNDGIQEVQDRINQVNSGQDMMMIQFQDMMSRRSNRINMATNLLKKINDASDAIVGNLR